MPADESLRTIFPEALGFGINTSSLAQSSSSYSSSSYNASSLTLLSTTVFTLVIPFPKKAIPADESLRMILPLFDFSVLSVICYSISNCSMFLLYPASSIIQGDKTSFSVKSVSFLVGSIIDEIIFISSLFCFYEGLTVGRSQFLLESILTVFLPFS